jgi:hypothetical protein
MELSATSSSVADSQFDQQVLGALKRPVIVAVILVRMMQMALDQIVDVITVRHGLMAATGGMLVPRRVPAAVVLGGAHVRIVGVRRDDMLVDVVAMNVVQMPVVQVVDMPVVADGGVAALPPVTMRMVGMFQVVAIAHRPVS